MAKKKAARKKAEQAPSFEEAVAELQQIVGALEDGSLPLEESMSQFERGVRLLKNCYQVLEQAEQRIEILTGVDEDGTVQTEPFDATATVDQSRSSTTEPQSEASDDNSGDYSGDVSSAASRAKSIRDDALF
ncbi:MAG: exodeoxyribonuclease VII small subunit [Planctomycetota bacterium]|jgi:exodeoxyribonuclease VII small subunit